MADTLNDEYERLLRERALEVLPEADLEGNAALFNVMRVANVIGRDLEQHVHRTHGSSRAGFRIMLVVWVMGPQSQKDLAGFANVTAATISSVLNTLDDEGLIVRTRSSADRRIVNIELTPAGEKAVADLYRLHLEREAQWLAALPESKKRQLASISRQILSARPPYDGA